MLKRRLKGSLIMLVLFFSVQNVFCADEDTSDLQKELDELKQERKALKDELKQIKDLLLKGQMPAKPSAEVQGVEFELDNNPSKGDDSAPLVIVEFSDYQCSFCARHTQQTFPDIYEKYISTGQLRYVFIDKPLPSHDMAAKTAEAAHCAAEQGKFWEMHEELLYDQESLKDMVSIASDLDLDVKKFESCMNSNKYADKVASNLSLANKLKIPSVPGFIIASRDPENPQKVKGIAYIRGAKPFPLFQAEIEQALAKIAR